MFVKRCVSKFSCMTYDMVKNRYPDFAKRVASKLIQIDPEKYIYIRNESIHAGEYYGPNMNGDYFPLDEMEKHYHTFIGSRVSVDHRDDLIVGEVLDSVLVRPIFVKHSGQDQEVFSGGGYIENLLGVEIEKANKLFPGLIENILNGSITDTSMGALVSYTICSVPTCGNIAYTEEQYCEHIRGCKNKEIRLASGETCKVYEICKGVTWFEDSIIVPLSLGGLAGGQGADPEAKIINIVSSSYNGLYKKFFDLYKYVEASNNKDYLETFSMLLDMVLKGGD